MDADRASIPLDLVLLTDFQWQLEHALDLQGVDVAIFADASVSGATSFDIAPLAPEFDASYSTHALSPACVLAVAERLGQSLPRLGSCRCREKTSSLAGRSARWPNRLLMQLSLIFARASKRGGL